MRDYTIEEFPIILLEHIEEVVIGLEDKINLPKPFIFLSVIARVIPVALEKHIL